MRRSTAGRRSWAGGVLVAGLLWAAQALAAAPGVLGAYVRGPEVLIPGTLAAVRVATHRATSATQSQPAAQVQVQATLTGGGRSQVLWTARSDAAGHVAASFQVPEWPAGKYALAITAQLPGERDVQTHPVQLLPSGKLLLQSDKPLYQPGHTVHLRAVAMRTHDGRPLTAASVLFELHDARNNRVFTTTTKLSAFGIAAADAVLADGVLLGTYQATAHLVGAAAAEVESVRLPVEVARYVLPKLKVVMRSERPYYRPGERVQLTLEGRYFTDKPVAAGEVTIEAALQPERAPDGTQTGAASPAAAGPVEVLPTLHGKLDAAGKVTLALELPKTLPRAELRLVLDAAVTDSAQQRQALRQELSVLQEPLRLDVVAEAGRLLPGMQSAVYVIAAQPDGTPAVGAQVELQLLGQTQTQTTDEIGVATFQSAAPTAGTPKVGGAKAGPDSCRSGEEPARITVRDRTGLDRSDSRCLPVADRGGLLLRTDRALYPSGAPLTVSITSADPGDTLAYVDIWKDRQVVDTVTVPLRAGRGEQTLPASERRFGTLGLQAYTIRPDGQRPHDARLVHVDRPGALRIEVSPQPKGATFTPGERGRIRLRVLDAHSGVGVPAALGVVMIDEALLALRPLRPGLLRTYFQLAEQARGAGRNLKARPGGYRVEQLVEDGAADAPRQLAARILLAGARPAWDLGWEIDPWAARRTAAEAQHERLSKAVERFGARELLGERSGRGFRYRQDLVAALLGAGLLRPGDTRDPWHRPYDVQQLIELAALGEFDKYATGELNERMSAIYLGLAAEYKAGRLASEPGTRRPVLGAADLQQLVARGKLPRGRLLDPWGGAFYFITKSRPFKVAGLSSRYVLGSAGPDGVVGTKDDLFAQDEVCALNGCGGPVVAGVPASEAFATLGLRGCGCAYGAGGGAVAGHSIRGVHFAVAQGGIGAATDNVRSAFPETMLYLPEVLTDQNGEAALEVAMADSITTWHFGAEAVAQDGRLGAATLPVRVLQDFYVDLDLPPSLTQHDEVAVPVAVYNYLPTPQKVTLEVPPAPWFELVGAPGAGATQVITVAPAQVGLGYVRLRVLGHGQQTLTVQARGAAVHDATARTTTIVPDGFVQTQSFAAQLTGGGKAPAAGRGEHLLAIPSTAIAGTAQVALKIYPALVAHAIEGLDSLLQLPHGCFEQTSSTTYPNALVLRFLKRTGQSTPAVEKKAREYLHVGYQRLLSFEVRGGGFSLFGQAPANKVLTAFGLEEFSDMAQVYPVDPYVIARTQQFLRGTQKDDGSFAPDSHYDLYGHADRFASSTVQVTAYVALALRHTDQRGGGGDAVRRAQAYVRREIVKQPPTDPYTLALVTELLPGELMAGKPVAEALWAQRKVSLHGESSYFAAKGYTPTHGRGNAATVETTAVAAQALLGGRGPERLARVEHLLRFLIDKKDALGNFTSTQATVRTLKALLTYQEAVRGLSRGTLTVLIDGKAAAQHKVSDDNVHVLDLAAATTAGNHQVTLRYDGTGPLGYQLLARYYQPLAAAVQKEPEVETAAAVTLTARLRGEAAGGDFRVGDKLRAEVTVSADRTLDIPMVVIGIPPGVDVDRGALDDGVSRRTYDKYELSPRQVTLYLKTLPAGSTVTFAVPLVARMPGRFAVPQSSVYEYYVPEQQVTTPPALLVVGEARKKP